MAPDANRACAAVLRGSSILMVHHVHDGRDYWTLPGGGVEAGETAAEAAVRELMEETGLAGTPVSRLYQRSYDRRDGREVTEDCYLVDVPGPDEPTPGSDPEAGAGRRCWSESPGSAWPACTQTFRSASSSRPCPPARAAWLREGGARPKLA